MTQLTIWHNPRCSKSRATLALLQERGLEPHIVRYLDAPPSEDTLRTVLKKLGLQPSQLARRGEAEWKQLRLADASEDEVLKALTEHPRLIERPIVLHGDRAALGRPP